jgi:hypothetical protein
MNPLDLLVQNAATASSLRGMAVSKPLSPVGSPARYHADGVHEQDGRWLVPVVEGIELSPEQARQYLVASAPLTERGGLGGGPPRTGASRIVPIPGRAIRVARGRRRRGNGRHVHSRQPVETADQRMYRAKRAPQAATRRSALGSPT